MRKSFGFTLVEVLIVTTIMAVLASVLYINFNEGRKQSRDAQRQSDLHLLQNAIENYRLKYGRYPTACNGTNWSGQLGSDYACTSGSAEYIEGISPEFISGLPIDPLLNGTASGYVYQTDAGGDVYKLIAFRTVEVLSTVARVTGGGEISEGMDDLTLCDHTGVSSDGLTHLCTYTNISNPWSGNAPSYCSYSNEDFQTSYAVWGGYADRPSDALVERYTEAIVCNEP